MKKWIIFVSIGIIILFAVIFGIYRYKENQKIKEFNIGAFKNYKCANDCPEEFSE